MNYLKFSLVTGGLVALMMGISGQAIAGSDEEQLARMKDPDQWPAPGRDFAMTRHSTLADINTKNVGKLQMVWLQGTNALRGHEGQPLVIKDVGGKPMLFMISGCPAMSNCNVVQALDLTDPDNPKEIWNYVKKTDRDESAVPRACCDTVNRGGSYADGKFVYGTLDGFVIALDGADRQGSLGREACLAGEGRDHHPRSVDRRRQRHHRLRRRRVRCSRSCDGLQR